MPKRLSTTSLAVSRSELALVCASWKMNRNVHAWLHSYLRRHILGSCSDLSSCYILVPVPSKSFAYICSATVLFPQIFFPFQLCSQAGLRVVLSTLLKAVYITCEPVVITGMRPYSGGIQLCVHEGIKSWLMCLCQPERRLRDCPFVRYKAKPKL